MEINCIMITAQVIGLAAMIVTVLSLQCRSNQNFTGVKLPVVYYSCSIFCCLAHGVER